MGDYNEDKSHKRELSPKECRKHIQFTPDNLRWILEKVKELGGREDAKILSIVVNKIVQRCRECTEGCPKPLFPV